MAVKRRKRKARKFRQVNFKLTVQQKKRVDLFCQKHGTTPVNMYKKAIMHFLTQNGFGAQRHAEPPFIENQMTIFDIVEDPINALSNKHHVQ